MSEITKYDAQKKKLEGLCEEHDFTYSIKKTVYPITLTIRPIQGVEEQLSMLEEADGSDYISPNASLTWIFADNDVTSKVEGGTFTMPKVLENKFVNIFKKMVSFWQQHFFRYLITNGTIQKSNMPVIDESDTGVDDEPSEPVEIGDPAAGMDDVEDQTPDEETFKAAKLLVRQENKASIALLQRRLNLGYSAAGRLMQELENAGVVGPYRGAKPREVLPYDQPED